MGVGGARVCAGGLLTLPLLQSGMPRSGSNPHTHPISRTLHLAPTHSVRSIIYHAGPTNSGKTYNALQAMRGAKSGAYCGPLR